MPRPEGHVRTLGQMSSSGRRHGWIRRAAILSAVASAAAVGAAIWRDRHLVGDPWDPTAPGYPTGESRVVITEDGVELSVTIAGDAGGPLVVLSHCWTGNRAIWGPVAERLVAIGHRVVLYDQRGHGESTYSDDAPTVAMLGHDLRAVLDAVDARDAVVVGHSMGGMSIQSYAAEHPDHFKEHVGGIVLVATAARVLGREVPLVVVDRLVGDRYPAWAAQGAVGRSIVGRALGDAAQRAHVDLTLDGWASTSGYARAGFLTALAGMDLREALRDNGVPARVLVGTRDLLTPPRLARQLADGIPGSELIVLPGAGHMLPLERPDEIVAAIVATTGSAGIAPPPPA
jgi:non-heme chloroperoxidase